MASHYSMEEGDTGVVSDVKIEIDVAEDTLHCCYRTEPLQYGYEIPRDTLVLFNVWGLHHDARYWPHPSRFNPYRFLN
ncbi:cytochrome P450 1A1-like isoform X4 [Littorina saxatilis]|uniref:cytochrome P450 1A1-like isoform X4 n=1 Tax=Littorina saxatilis TaxID=31220 RepID=UPI0038B52811